MAGVIIDIAVIEDVAVVGIADVAVVGIADVVQVADAFDARLYR